MPSAYNNVTSNINRNIVALVNDLIIMAFTMATKMVIIKAGVMALIATRVLRPLRSETA